MKYSKSSKQPTDSDNKVSDGTLGKDSKPKGLNPVERALDLIGARWTLILVRHLLAGPHGFQELRDLTGITPRLLSVRLSELIELGFVDKIPFGNRAHYKLTDFGESLEPVVRELSLWWLRHAMQRFGPHEGVDPATVFEAITYLLREDREGDADSAYDVRLTVQENGGWTVDFSNTPKRDETARRLTEDLSAEPQIGAADAEEPEAAEQLSKTPPGGSYAANDAGAGGSVVWHPRPYKPDRN